MATNAKRLRRSFLVTLALGAAATGWMLSRSVGPTQVPLERFRFTDVAPSSSAIDFRLTDVNGQPRTLRDYQGRVVALFFGFTRCPNVCPTGLFKLAQVMKALGPARDQVQVLFVTLDPERDTPEVLRRYVTAFDPQFEALTGTPEQIDGIAATYHVMHFKEAIGTDYTIGHSAATYLLDAQRRHRLVAPVDAAVEDLVHDIRLLAQ